MENETKVKVIKFDVDWLEIKNLCRKTVSMKDSTIEPTDEWKRKLLLAEHSPLRHSLITIDIEGIPFYVMGHLVRHSVGVTPYVSTSRSDRTGVPREERRQTDLVTMRMDMNVQSLINISRKRLCNQADATTKDIWESVVKEIAKYDENIAWACVPEGIKSCGCTESFGNCKMCNSVLGTMSKEDLLNVSKRYDTYNTKVRKLCKK